MKKTENKRRKQRERNGEEEGEGGEKASEIPSMTIQKTAAVK